MEEGCLPQVIWQWLWLRGFFSNCSVFSRASFCRKLGVFDFGNVQDLTYFGRVPVLVSCSSAQTPPGIPGYSPPCGERVQPAPSWWPRSLGVHNNSERNSFKAHAGSLCMLIKNTCCFSPLFLFCNGFKKKK